MNMSDWARDRSTHLYGNGQAIILPVLETHEDGTEVRDSTQTIQTPREQVLTPVETTRKPQSTIKTPELSRTTLIAKNSRSVWSDYGRSFDVDFGGGTFHVASAKTSGKTFVFVQECQATEMDARLATIARTQSSHFVKCLGCFVSPRTSHFVFEPMNMSLAHIRKARRFATEQEIVAIVCQVSRLANALETAN